MRITAGIVLSLLILFNLFQYAQFSNKILDPYRTTAAYYKAVFLKTSVPPGAEKLLLVDRDFNGHDHFKNPQDYHASVWISQDFDKDTVSNIIHDPDGRIYYRMRESEEFTSSHSSTFKEISSKDHVWFRIEFDARFPETSDGEPPFLVTTMERVEGSYGYKAHEIKPDSIAKGWKHYTIDYLSPEIRDPNDVFKCYFWKRSKVLFDIDNFSIRVFER